MIGNNLPDLGRLQNLHISTIDTGSLRNSTTEEHALQTFKYPRASLLGLPLELRLQIYTHLAESIHFHLDYKPDPTWIYPWSRYDWNSDSRMSRMSGSSNGLTRFCAAPDPSFPQLCTRPFFSGLHTTEEQCGKLEAVKSDPFALRATCETIYEETRGVLDPKNMGFSIFTAGTRGVLSALKPDARMRLTRLTIVHAPLNISCAMHQAMAYLGNHPLSFVSLRTIAVQVTQPHYKFCVKRPRSLPVFDPESTWQNLWFVKALNKTFNGDVTVVLEAWVVFRAGYRENSNTVDEMVVIRGVKWGSKERKRRGGVEFNVSRGGIVATDLDAPWKNWWRADGMGYGRRPCV